MNFRKLKLTNDTIHIKNLKSKFTATLISDIHIDIKNSKKRLKKAVKLSNEQNPDFVFILGDFMSFSSKKVKDLESISKLKSNNGVYAVLGNHDYVHLPKLKKLELTANNIAKALQELNVNVLRNQSTLINIGDSKINLIGFDSFKTKKINVNKAFSNVNHEHPKIILAHEPDSVLHLDEHEADIMFCGHTHGCTFRLPIIGPFFMLSKLGAKFDKWHKIYNGQKMYISSGINEAILEPRLFNPPEVNLIEFVPQ
mgnify:CR=1 FL=1|jgi:uncharacterized protein